jgi:Trk K+ transport system NAD-binding subunit
VTPTPPTSYDVVVLGGGPTGVELATELSARGRRVVVFGDETSVKRARRRGLSAHESTLASANQPVECVAETVVVATPSDARTLLLASAAGRTFETDDVVALVTDPATRVAFDDAGIDTVCVATAVSRATTDVVTLDGQSAPDVTTDATERVPLRE